MRMKENRADPDDWESARAEQSAQKVERNSSISFLLAITGLPAQKAGDFMAFKMTEGASINMNQKAEWLHPLKYLL